MSRAAHAIQLQKHSLEVAVDILGNNYDIIHSVTYKI